MSTQTISIAPLTEVLAAHSGQVPVVPFLAIWGGEPCVVRSVLERTAVVTHPWDSENTRVVRLTELELARVISWESDRGTRSTNNGQPKRGWNGPKTSTTDADRQAVRNRSNERALATQAEGETMPTGKPNPETLARPKTCTVCGKEKPRDQFPKTGRTANRCYDCAAIAEPKTVKKAPIKSAKESLPVAKAPLVLTLAHGNGATVDDALVNLVKNLVSERNALRAQLDAIEAALVSA